MESTDGDRSLCVNEDRDRSPGRMKARCVYTDHLREWFCTKPFDHTLAAYFPEATIEKYGLTNAARTISFTRKRLERAGYKGWYVIVVHDKRGSTLWHPHLLLDGRNGQYQRVVRQLHPVADVSYEVRGPIVSLSSAAGYCAMRACENGDSTEQLEFAYMGGGKPRRARGSRGRGRQALRDGS